LGAAAFVCYAPGLFWGLPYGKAINGAYQILDGGIVYRDFWTMYAPGMFYLTAGVFKFIGREVVFQGAVAILIRAGIAATLFLLVRRLGLTRRLAAALALVLAAGMWQTNPEIISYHPALLFLLLFLNQVIRYFHEGTARTLFWAGIWAGLAACFKHDVAAYFVLSAMLGYVLSWTLAARPRPSHWISPVKAAAFVALGALVCFLPVAVWIAAKAGKDAFQDLFVFPSTVFAKVRREQYAPLFPRLDLLLDWLADPLWFGKGRRALYNLAHWIRANFPQYVFLVAVGVVLGKRRTIPGPRLASILTLSAGILFFWMAAHVQQNTHLFTMAVLSSLLGAIAWTGLAGTAQRRTKILLSAFAAVYGFALVVNPLMAVSYVATGWAEHKTFDLPGVRWIRVSDREYAFYEPIARFLRENTEEGEYIYVGLERHDAIVINDPRFYYLSDRLSCCRYGELHPGVADRRDQQEEIIRDMEMRDVRAAVLWQFFGPDQDTTANRLRDRLAAAVPGTGATRLDEYISSRFSPVMTRGHHTVVWRNDLPLPQADD
jgi:hypothetical protein